MCLLHLSTITVENIGTVWGIILLSWGILEVFYYMVLKIVLFDDF